MGDKKGENAMTEETMLMLVPAAALAIFAVALLFAVGFSKGGKVLGKHNKTLQNMLGFQHILQHFYNVCFQAVSCVRRRSRPAQAIMAATAKNRAII